MYPSVIIDTPGHIFHRRRTPPKPILFYVANAITLVPAPIWRLGLEADGRQADRFMKMTCEILDADPRLSGVVRVRVPGIYGPVKGKSLPRSMARLVRPAAVALRLVYRELVAAGGHLYISDMFRSAAAQQRAHQDYLTGRKPSYSPPSCAGVHEAARAIDIDAFDTGIGHRRVRVILNHHGWTNVVPSLTGPECWHYEFRQECWSVFLRKHGYAAMAHAMKLAIGNTNGYRAAQSRNREVARLQAELNTLTGSRLAVDGIYGPQTMAAVRKFQREQRLQVDGIAGPITRRRLRKIIANHPAAAACPDGRHGL